MEGSKLKLFGFSSLINHAIWSVRQGFSGAVKTFFGQRWLSPPLRKIGPYAYDGRIFCM